MLRISDGTSVRSYSRTSAMSPANRSPYIPVCMKRRPICTAPCEVHELRQEDVAATVPFTYSVTFWVVVSNDASRCVHLPTSATVPYAAHEPSESTSVTGLLTAHFPVF